MYKGLMSGVTWALDTTILGLVLAMAVFNDPLILLVVPFLSCFLHDLFGAIAVNMYGASIGVSLRRLLQLEVGKYLVIGAIIGGPIGMAAYCCSVYLIGPVLTALVAALTPICTSLLARIFLKSDVSSRTVICIAASVAGLILLGLAPDDYVRHGSLWVGLLVSVLTPISWAAEIVIADYALNILNVENDVRCIQVRETVSAIVYGLVVLPIVGGYSILYKTLSIESIMGFLVAGSLGGISYILYYQSIGECGSIRANLLNTSYSPLTILFTCLVTMTVPDMVVLLSTALILSSAICATWYSS